MIETFENWLQSLRLIETPKTCSVFVCLDSNAIEICLDSDLGCDYSEHIKGEGADICLYRHRETNKIVGCRLPMYMKRVVFSCGGTETAVDLE